MCDSPGKNSSEDETRGRIEIYWVDPDPSDHGESAWCVVRCLGGVIRVGDVLSQEGTGERYVVDGIERYGRTVPFFDPPHSGRVHLTGGPCERLGEGDRLDVSR
ncbi:hypothetical protein [Streptomyces sp. NPDC056144]|uniref:hypothetical protein n=1 Tax=unclassified Streptomyces TaxID=2593676 RepID=UPI0035D8B1AF